MKGGEEIFSKLSYKDENEEEGSKDYSFWAEEGINNVKEYWMMTLQH